ncbi:MAG TPA: hypothetical protein VEB66_17115 [Opitutaceae bacterium]|nr:hypothetical protein [Opitutaceae bacterium]
MELKLQGAEGLDAAGIRQEIERGGRLVMFTYCVSLIVVTLKRPTAIHLVKPGQSAAARSLPYTLLSLVTGWWGFPWGPVYTIQTLYQNLRGGFDVTDDVLAAILPPATRPAAGTASAAAHHAAEPTGPRFSAAAAVLAGAVVAGLIFAGVAGYCWYRGQNQPVVVVSGLDRPYSFTLDGETHTLKPYGALRLTKPQGRLELRPAADSAFIAPATLEFEIPFFSRLGDSRLAIVNPDATAIAYVEDITYVADHARAGNPPEPSYRLLTNATSHFIPQPDFTLDAPPESVSMPKNAARVVRTRFNYARPMTLEASLGVVREKLGADGVREHLRLQARVRADEALLQAVTQELPAAEALALLRTRLAERPVLVEWHRYYQETADGVVPDDELLAEYRAAAQGEPGQGALLYLLGRLTAGRAPATELYRRALAAPEPCAYAWVGLAWNDLNGGDFEAALAALEKARAAGIASDTLRYSRRNLMIALGRMDELLAETREAFKASPLDYTLARDEILLLALQGAEADVCQARTSEFLKTLEPEFDPAQRQAVERSLQLAAALGRRDEPGYLSILGAASDAPSRFNVALSAGDHATAVRCLEEFDVSTQHSLYRFLVYIAAAQANDPAAADALFAAALRQLAAEGRDERAIAALAAGTTPPDPAALEDVVLLPAQRRVIACAFGLRFPGDRERYFAIARRMNFDPEFPAPYLRRVLGAPSPAPAL